MIWGATDGLVNGESETAEERSLFLVPILLALAENKRHDIDIKSGGIQA